MGDIHITVNDGGQLNLCTEVQHDQWKLAGV